MEALSRLQTNELVKLFSQCVGRYAEVRPSIMKLADLSVPLFPMVLRMTWLAALIHHVRKRIPVLHTTDVPLGPA